MVLHCKKEIILMKLGLGTVQFGLEYGINHKAVPSVEEIKNIIELSKLSGIKIIDTAYSYGNSEELLGQCFNNEHNFNIVTKTIKDTNPDKIGKAFEESLKRLNQKSVYGFMFHEPSVLLENNAKPLWNKLISLKDDGFVKKIGVSVYTAEEIDIILERFKIDIIQLPINLFDQRLIHSGHLKKLKDKGIEIHARSIFLKGLVFKKPDELSEYFNPYKEFFFRYHKIIEENNCSALELSLNFGKNIPEIDSILCGVRSVLQLKEIVDAYNKSCCVDYSELFVNDEKLLNPRFWQ